MGPGGREPYEDEIVEVGREVIKESQMVYAFSDHTTRPEIQAALDEELGFMEDYYNKNGFHWTGTTYPRPPPTLPMITANKIGEEVLVPITDPSARQWHCKLKPPKAPVNVRDDPRNDEYVNACLGSDDQTPDESVTYRGDVEDGILVEVVSVEPRVFVVKRFLSNFEADYIVSQAQHLLVFISIIINSIIVLWSTLCHRHHYGC